MPIVIPAQAGIQICASDQDVEKPDLINELDSGLRRNDGLSARLSVIICFA
jgi:hypothetical protein